MNDKWKHKNRKYIKEKFYISMHHANKNSKRVANKFNPNSHPPLFIHVFTNWWIANVWMGSCNESNMFMLSSSCTGRLQSYSLINTPAAVWVFVYIWTACAYVQTPRPQNTKLLRGVGDNCHDNIHSPEEESRDTVVHATLHTVNWSAEAAFPKGFGLLVWSILI